MMSFKKIILLMSICCFVLMSTESVSAERSALIALYDNSSVWTRASQAKVLLEQNFGFSEVRLLVNATPHEITKEIVVFLKKATDPHDQRLIWVSGSRSDYKEPSCDEKFHTIKPLGAVFMMAPSCFENMIQLPPVTRHFSLSTPRPSRIRKKQNQSLGLAYLLLPSNNPLHIDRADQIILEVLKTHQSDSLAPDAFLNALRLRFRENESLFTPSLEITPGQFRPHFDEPPLTSRGQKLNKDEIAVGRAVKPRVRHLNLYRSPLERAEPALRLPPNTPFFIIRRSQNGVMAYGQAGTHFFGWALIHELTL